MGRQESVIRLDVCISIDRLRQTGPLPFLLEGRITNEPEAVGVAGGVQ